MIKKKRQEICWSTLTPTGHTRKPFRLLQRLAATVESLVTDVRYPVLIRFPTVTQYSKGTHYFHRVVGLMVLSMSVVQYTPYTPYSCWTHSSLAELSVNCCLNWVIEFSLSLHSDCSRSSCFQQSQCNIWSNPLPLKWQRQLQFSLLQLTVTITFVICDNISYIKCFRPLCHIKHYVFYCQNSFFLYNTQV